MGKWDQGLENKEQTDSDQKGGVVGTTGGTKGKGQQVKQHVQRTHGHWQEGQIDWEQKGGQVRGEQQGKN